jgi:hypothetical protein
MIRIFASMKMNSGTLTTDSHKCKL